VRPEPEQVAVAIPEADLEDLRRRLRATRFADDFANEGWSYGVERGWLEELVRYWADEYDWRAQEAVLNALPHYRVELDGVPIHFVHARGRGPRPLPLVLTHGWPWTFWDWKDVIGPLADPAAHGGDAADAFDVVVPSLPGFGFSTPLRTTGVDGRRIAQLWARLMAEVLGYERFGAGGGDWGAIVTAELGHGFPEHLLGVWLTLPMLPGVNLRELGPDAFAPDEAWMAERAREAREVIQSHRAVHQYEPQTLAYALVDSPAGTGAWLWQRRRDWSGSLESFDRDFLCTTASIYWLTKTIGTSLRLYAEHWRGGPPPPLHDRRRVIDVPTGIAVFPRELLFIPRALAEERTNLQRWTVMPRGGHFAPAEEPGLVIEELRTFFRPLRGSA
jgi:pimeloyl-ACP methyl ester carboxylesterase